jgi:hypothetical protein
MPVNSLQPLYLLVNGNLSFSYPYSYAQHLWLTFYNKRCSFKLFTMIETLEHKNDAIYLKQMFDHSLLYLKVFLVLIKITTGF